LERGCTKDLSGKYDKTKTHTTYANEDSPGTMIVIYGKTPNS